ncbi:DNA internalization-related competence protein ComEC/Rec2 [Trinickia violacea]|uniref:DNA internalization-related competence protein ComEC/Rec2 n=1 Tax=Trinickia violacea TaxID=2571746 RepID=A0A4P8ITQ5_9BURK|nr:DNA internalization-related competence protein ComEC/Rec2 [Trinickia violacea]QCP49239.1 DNA internalization-related competence protein ComEC/Rec2 [Trinickia violacea]
MRAVLCGFALGVFVLQQQPALPGALAWSVSALLFVAAVAFARWVFRREARWLRRAGFCAIVVGAALVGFGYAAMRAEVRLRDALPVSWEGRDIELAGHIRGLPVRDANGVRFLFAVDTDEARRTTGIPHFPPTIQLTWIDRTRAPAALPLLAPGDRWRLIVRLKRPHGNANFGVRDPEAALLARNVRATGYVSAASAAGARRLPGRASGVGLTIDRWRFALRARIDTVLAEAPHRGIVTALAVGAQDAVSAEDWLLMRNTGTSHLIAISGLHIGLVAGLCAALAGWLWRRSCFLARVTRRDWPLIVPAQIVAALAGAAVAAFYAALAGFNVPAQRALWMLTVVSIAFVSGRSVAPSMVLAWALSIVLLADPWAVVTPGFWLSFCAVAAILLVVHGHLRVRAEPQWEDDEPPRSRVSRAFAVVRRRLMRLRERLLSAARVQYAVTLGLAPLTVYWFSQIPLIGPFANAFAIPWVSVLVTPTVLVGVVLPAPLDAWAFRAAHALVEALAAALQALSGPAWTIWRLPQPDTWALSAAALGVVWCLMPRGWPLRWAAPLTWLPLLMPPPAGPSAGTFRVTALDIGQGMSVLIETAHHALLFDTGPGPESTHAGERIVVPFLQANGVRSLDALVISHADSDHAGGADAVLQAIPVRQLLAGLPPSNRLWGAASRAGADTLRCAAGQRWQWDGVEFTTLWPDPGPLPKVSNAQSCVLRVVAPGISALLTGDVDAPSERVLVARARDALRAQVLVVPHHGSKSSSTEPFLDSIDPLIAVFQVGYLNRYHHPNPSVWARYAARNIELTRSDRDGAVRIDSNGGALVLERYRETHRRYWMD